MSHEYEEQIHVTTWEAYLHASLNSLTCVYCGPRARTTRVVLGVGRNTVSWYTLCDEAHGVEKDLVVRTGLGYSELKAFVAAWEVLGS